MNISTASALIASHLAAGRIDRDAAIAAQAAIRGARYGNRMNDDRRAAMLRERFGIVAEG